jgi:ABC-2 type transport system permease protein
MISSQYLKARLSYRADFFISSFGMAIGILPGVLGLAVVFQSIPALAGWTLDELIFVYAFSLLALCPVQIVFDNIWQLRTKIQDGSFVKYYFRPLNMLFYYISEMVDLKGFTQLVMAIGLLAWSSVQLQLAWTFPMALGFAFLLVSASLVMVGLLLAGACSAFWIVNSFSVLWLFSRFRDYAKYPLGIYSAFFRFLFSTVIPIGFIAFYPAEWLLHPERAGIAVWFTPLAGAACFALGALVWSKGVRSWSGTGT